MESEGKDDGIVVNYVHEQNGVRLLEIPAELLDAFTTPSTNTPQLVLKSSTPPSSGDASTATAAHAVLTTNDKTYNLRQVQSSNSIFLLQLPADPRSQIPFPSLSIVSTCSSTLEILPPASASANNVHAILHLSQHLPAYRAPEDVLNSLPIVRSRTEMFADSPFSNAELSEAFRQLCGFEVRLSNDALCAFLPTASTLLGIWSAFFIATQAAAIELAASDGVDATTITGLVEDVCGETKHPPQVLNAIISRLTALLTKSTEAMDTTDDSTVGSGSSAMPAKILFDQITTTEWVGQIILGSGVYEAEGKRIWAVLERWKSLLPTAWAEQVNTGMVMRARDQVEQHRRALGLGSNDDTAANEAKKGTGGAAASGGKRNWHERLKKKS